MASQETLRFPGTNDGETQPALYLVADADVDRSGGYIGVLFRYMQVKDGGGARRKNILESQFLMSASEACELRDLLNQALADMSAVAHH